MKSNAKNDRPICLVLGQGVTALGAVRALSRAEIPYHVATEADDILRRSRSFEGLPSGLRPVVDPDQLESWLRKLPDGRFFLLPCSDAWTIAVSRLHDSPDRQWCSSVASAAAIEALADKNAFRATMEALDLPHPRTYSIDRAEDLASMPDEVFAHAFLKPRNSQEFFARYGVKGKFVNDRDAAQAAFAHIQQAGFGMVLQEYIPGPATNHFFVDGFRPADHSPARLLARQRLRMYPSDFGNSTDMVTIPLSEVRQATETLEKLFSAIGYTGIFSAEFKLDNRDGNFKLLEVNCRPWWYVGYADACGLHVCQYAYQDQVGEKLSAFSSYRLGRRCVYPLFDWSARQDNLRAGLDEQSVLATLKNWLTGVQPVFSWSDPLPAIGVFLSHLKDIAQRPFRRQSSKVAT